MPNSGANGLNVTVAVTDAGCDGLNGGSIVLNVTGGEAPYEYIFQHGTGVPFNGPQAVIDNLAEGNYDVTVIDADGCIFTHHNIKVGRSSDLMIGSIYADAYPTCGNTNGSIYVNATGGSGTYRYAYSKNNGPLTAYVNLPGNKIIGNLGAGTYRIHIVDAGNALCGVAISESVVLNASDYDMELFTSVENASACGVSDGSISFSVTGGNGSSISYYLNGTLRTPDNNRFRNLRPGVYVLEARDNYCGASTKEIIIGADDGGLDAWVPSVTNAACGVSSGSFTIMVDGTAPYSYQISGGAMQLSNIHTIPVNHLTAGNYTWKVTDYRGCYAESRQEIRNSDANDFTVTAIAKNTSCDGTNGGITLEVSGGTAPYLYHYNGFWRGPIIGTSATITDLTVGSYTIIVTDNEGCTYTCQNIKVDKDNDLQVGTIFVAQQPTCQNQTGSIHIKVTGGSGSYQYAYTKDGGPLSNYSDLASTGIITGLGSGTYRIYVQDKNALACGIVISSAITLYPINSDLSLEVVTQPATDCQTADGELTITISGGTAPYSYRLDGGTSAAVTGTVITENNLFSGIHTIEVADANNCAVSSGEITIGAGTSLVANASAKRNSDCGESTGSFRLTAANGTGPYTWKLNGGKEFTTTNYYFTFSNLAAGSHAWTVTDANRCYAEGTQIINNNGAPTYAVSAVSTDANCDGTTGGTITLTVNGGAVDYSYSIDNGVTWEAFVAASGTAVIDNLAEGSYDIIVKDGNNCTFANHGVKIGRSTKSDLKIGTTFIASQPSCSTPSGSIHMNATGGSGNYQYALSKNNDALTAYAALPSDRIIGDLGSGTYKIYIHDAKAPACGVAVSTSIILSPLDTDLAVNVMPNAASTCTSTDGSLNVTVSGGTAPYTYKLNGGTSQTITGTTVTIPNLNTGSYIVEITDAGSCVMSSGEIILGATNGLTVTVDNSIASRCGESTGAFTLAVENGTAPYMWKLNNDVEISTTINTITFSNLIAGNHIWAVTDANGCYAEGRQAIDNNSIPAFEVVVSVTDAFCDGTKGGSIKLTVTGGEAPYQYRIDNGTNWTPFTGNSAEAVINDLASGSYTVMVRDVRNCIYEYKGIVIGRMPIPVVTIQGNNTLCEGTTENILSTSGSNYSSYLWSTGETTPTINAVTAGDYTVTVEDSNGCSITSNTFRLVVNPAPVMTINFLEGSDTICLGGRIVMYADSNPAFDYLWNTGDNTSAIRMSLNTPGIFTYSVRVTNPITRCSTTDSVSSTVVLNPSVEIVTNASAQGDTICEGSTVILRASGATYYNWSDGAGNADSVVLAGLTEGSYTYTVTGVDIYGCQGVDSVSVMVNPVPVVTPVNDVAILSGSSVEIPFNGNATEYRWSMVGGDDIGIPAYGITNPLSIAEVTISGHESQAANYQVVPVLIDGLLECAGVPEPFKIIVDPQPVIDSVGDKKYCAGTVVPVFEFTGNIPAASYRWHRLPDSDIIPGLPESGTGSMPSFTALNSDTSCLDARYKVIMSYTSTVSGSNYSDTATFGISIQPVPVVTPVNDVAILSGSSVEIPFSGNATEYRWSMVGGDDIGIPAYGITNPLSIAEVTISGHESQAANYQVVPVLIDGLLECAGNPEPFKITVEYVPSGDASLHGIRVNGNDVSVADTIHYDIGCDEIDRVTIDLETAPGATLSSPDVAITGNNFTIHTGKPMNKYIRLNIISEDRTQMSVYTLRIERRFLFEQVVKIRWNNTMTVINNPENNGGYTFTAYQWYKNGEKAGNGQSYSAGVREDDRLNPHDVYYVEMATDSVTLRTCRGNPVLKSQRIIAYPNPAATGQLFHVYADVEPELLQDAVIDVYDLSGNYVDRLKVEGQLTPVDNRYKTGLYLLKLKGKDGFEKVMKLLVQ